MDQSKVDKEMASNDDDMVECGEENASLKTIAKSFLRVRLV